MATDHSQATACHPSELPDHLKDAVQDSRMSPEHDHLNELLDKTPMEHTHDGVEFTDNHRSIVNETDRVLTVYRRGVVVARLKPGEAYPDDLAPDLKQRVEVLVRWLDERDVVLPDDHTPVAVPARLLRDLRKAVE